MNRNVKAHLITLSIFAAVGLVVALMLSGHELIVLGSFGVMFVVGMYGLIWASVYGEDKW